MSSARSFGLEGIGRVLPVGIASLLGSGHIGRVGAREAGLIILTSRHFLSPLGAGPDRRQPREPAPSC